jgi:protein TonB
MKTVQKKGQGTAEAADKHFVDHPVASVLFNPSAHCVDKKLLSDFIRIKDQKTKTGNSNEVMFFSISLCLSLLLVIYAFEWRTADETATLELSQNVSEFNDLIEVPQTKQLQKPPAINVAPAIIEVADEKIIENIEINLDIEMSEDTRIEEVIFTPQQVAAIPEERADEIFVIVEDQPIPQGGMQEFYKFVSENLKFPAKAAHMGIEGRVFIEFIVEKDGSLTDIKVARGIGGGCDEEAVRVISAAPKWNPGKQRGRPVRVRMIMPITFKIL